MASTYDTGTFKPYDSKAVTRRQATAYSSFGWVLSNEKPNVAKKKKNSPEVVVRRKLGFADNPELARVENEYLKLEKKKYRQLPILGIICFFLMIAFLFVSAMELAYGISDIIAKSKEKKDAAVEDKPETAIVRILTAEEAADKADDKDKKDDAAEDGEAQGIMDMVKEYAGLVKNDYLSYINNLFDGKTNEETGEYTPGILDKAKESLPESIVDYVTSEIVVGVIALILFILCLIFFCEIAKKKSKRAKKNARMAMLRRDGEQIVNDMRRSDLSLMNKADRKRYATQMMLTNAIRDALGNRGDDYDDDDSAYL